MVGLSTPLCRLSEITFSGYRYWLSGQSNSEPYAFIMYDTKGGNHARCKLAPPFLPRYQMLIHLGVCPHVSFDNPFAPVDALPRQSVETRSVVITKD